MPTLPVSDWCARRLSSPGTLYDRPVASPLDAGLLCEGRAPPPQTPAAGRAALPRPLPGLLGQGTPAAALAGAGAARVLLPATPVPEGTKTHHRDGKKHVKRILRLCECQKYIKKRIMRVGRVREATDAGAQQPKRVDGNFEDLRPKSSKSPPVVPTSRTPLLASARCTWSLLLGILDVYNVGN
eukprot:1074285-Prorocentrum_minimum.AAC.1